jgi:hypothetical protein
MTGDLRLGIVAKTTPRTLQDAHRATEAAGPLRESAAFMNHNMFLSTEDFFPIAETERPDEHRTAA